MSHYTTSEEYDFLLPFSVRKHKYINKPLVAKNSDTLTNTPTF